MGSMRRLTETIWVAGQLSLDDIAAAHTAGVGLIVNHRPDDEELGQPSSDSLASAAKALGMTYVHAPVRGLPNEAAVTATAEALAASKADEQALLFCRSGMRSAAAWAMAMTRSGQMSATQARTSAAAAGYDLGGLPL